MTKPQKSCGQVHIKVRAADAALTDQELLSEAEHIRLANMHEGARPSFVTARSMLRRTLGECMGLLPAGVPLVQDGTGRVLLDGFDDREPPFFSVSHTGGAEDSLAAIAVSNHSAIGIDIQQIDEMVDWRRIAARRLPEHESDMVLSMPENEGRMLFFTLWAIKESFVKMEDGTLMRYLREVELDLNGDTIILASPTPKGLSKASIYFTYLPEFYLVIAAVASKPVEFILDNHIVMSDRRPDPLKNNAAC